MADLDSVASSWRLDEVPIPPEVAEEKINRMLADQERNATGKLHHLCLAIIPQGSQDFIGWCGVDHSDPTWSHPVLFYLLKAAWWGKGLGTEAARALLEYAFKTLEIPCLDSACAFDNLASKRIMEKIGMRYLGLDEENGHSFSLTREEFLQVDKQ
jgi:RimJ/RimL family protein N-acetyltransferase